MEWSSWFQPGRRALRILATRVQALLSGEVSRGFVHQSLSGEAAELARLLEQWREAYEDQQGKLATAGAARQEVLDALREGILAVSSDKRITMANARLFQLFGVEQPAVGKPLVQVLRHRSVLAAFDRALAGEQVSESLTVEPLPGGSRRVELQVVPLHTPSETAAVGLFMDVTRLARLEKIRREFMADFSHEVRTPLAGLRTAIESFDSTSLTRLQQDKLRKVIGRQLRRLERLVEDLVELDQIESGQLVLQREPTELLRLLRDLRDDFAEQIEQRRITLRVEGQDSVANVDPAKVQQIFSNLLENAIKFSRPEGTVELLVEDTPGESVIRVVDHGEGIAPEEQERIFNRFYRIDKSRSQDVPGTGLGLSITKHLVLRHGGTIRVFSQPARGATFEVRLPKGDLQRYPRLAEPA